MLYTVVHLPAINLQQLGFAHAVQQWVVLQLLQSLLGVGRQRVWQRPVNKAETQEGPSSASSTQLFTSSGTMTPMVG